MNSNNDCKNRRQAIAALVLDELEAHAAEKLREHIDACETCRSLYHALTDEEKTIHSAFEAMAERSKNVQDEFISRLQKESHKPSKRSTFTLNAILNSRITKLTVAASMTIVALIAIHQFVGPQVAWAEVLENIRNLRTLTFLIRTSDGGPPVAKAMVVDPYLMRTEFLGEQERAANLLGGQILIVDAEKGKALILDTEKKKATIRPARQAVLPVYDAYRNFREMEDFSVEQVGRRRIGDIEAVGFRLKKQDGEREIMVWADPETKLPVLMEESVEDAQGQSRRFLLTDIVFDAELDRSLFSLELPEGYEEDEEGSALVGRQVELVNRVKSAANVDRILKACRKYAAEHGGQWPDTLNELAKYGVHEETFINPRQPGRKVGYIYLKPPVSAPQDRIVLYEAYDEWNEGINVGYASTRVQFVRDKSEFENQLKESSSSK
ncbi:MAG: hypothetical protein ACYST6_09590 [Planctomycetota bacterium]|jgi:outer membrane lipoprotein-sorting protein